MTAHSIGKTMTQHPYRLWMCGYTEGSGSSSWCRLAFATGHDGTGCFTCSEKGAKESLYLREQLKVLFRKNDSHMLEIELNCDSSGISPMVKARYTPENSPE